MQRLPRGDSRGTPVAGSVTVAIKQDQLPSPNLSITDLGDGSYRLWFDGIPGTTYRIQYTENLAAPNWLLLGSETANPFGRIMFTDTPPAGSLERYYRSVCP